MNSADDRRRSARRVGTGIVNGLAIGEAKQFNTLDEVYDFPAPGNYGST